MTFEKIRWTAVLLAVGCSTTGALVHAQRAAQTQPQPQPKAAAPAPKRPAPDAPAQPSKLSHGDGQPDGKRSLGGSGEMVEFALPADGRKVAGLRIHGARYGTPNPPEESFLIYFLDENLEEVFAARLAPYALFERGEGRWVDVTFARPVEAAGRTWVVLDFLATGTKGVYMSYDASTGGKHSRVGLPGIKSKPVDFGDWMVEVILAR